MWTRWFGVALVGILIVCLGCGVNPPTGPTALPGLGTNTERRVDFGRGGESVCGDEEPCASTATFLLVGAGGASISGACDQDLCLVDAGTGRFNGGTGLGEIALGLEKVGLELFVQADGFGGQLLMIAGTLSSTSTTREVPTSECSAGWVRIDVAQGQLEHLGNAKLTVTTCFA